MTATLREEKLLLKVAATAKLLDEPAVREVYAALRAQLQRDEPPQLGPLLLARGVSFEALTELLRERGLNYVVCPACGETFKLKAPKPGAPYTCLGCQAKGTIPDQKISVVTLVPAERAEPAPKRPRRPVLAIPVLAKKSRRHKISPKRAAAWAERKAKRAARARANKLARAGRDFARRAATAVGLEGAPVGERAELQALLDAHRTAFLASHDTGESPDAERALAEFVREATARLLEYAAEQQAAREKAEAAEQARLQAAKADARRKAAAVQAQIAAMRAEAEAEAAAEEAAAAPEQTPEQTPEPAAAETPEPGSAAAAATTPAPAVRPAASADDVLTAAKSTTSATDAPAASGVSAAAAAALAATVGATAAAAVGAVTSGRASEPTSGRASDGQATGAGPADAAQPGEVIAAAGVAAGATAAGVTPAGARAADVDKADASATDLGATDLSATDLGAEDLDADDAETRLIRKTKAAKARATKGAAVVADAQALARLLAGDDLAGVKLGRLDAAGVVFDKPIKLEGATIAEADFQGAVFSRKANFQGVTFSKKPNFAEAKFEGEAIFRRARFLDGADFKRVRFNHKVSFNYAFVPRHATFKAAQFARDAVLSNVRFERGVDLSDSVFEAKCGLAGITTGFRSDFSGMTARGEATFSNSTFEDVVDLSRASFEKEVKFFTTHFLKPVKFASATFASHALFHQVHFADEASLKGSTFAGEILFDKARIDKHLSFADLRLAPGSTFSFLDAAATRLTLDFELAHEHLKARREERHQEAAREYGFLRQVYANQYLYNEEDQAYYFQRRHSRLAKEAEATTGRQKALAATEWLLLDVACGYGTKLKNIAYSSLAVLAAFAVIYWMASSSFVFTDDAYATWLRYKGPVLPSFGFFDALIYSFKTLVFADLGSYMTMPGSFMAKIVAIQAGLGFIILSLLVATFTRKVTR